MTILAACEVSPVPIAPLAEAPFDSSLVGGWRAASPQSSDTTALTVLEFRAPEYYIEVAASNSIFDTVRARGFITRIGDVTFMNADELTSEPRGYTFYRYSMAGDTLIINGVKETFHKFTASEALRAFLSANINTDSIYDDTLRLVKIEE